MSDEENVELKYVGPTFKDETGRERAAASVPPWTVPVYADDDKDHQRDPVGYIAYDSPPMRDHTTTAERAKYLVQEFADVGRVFERTGRRAKGEAIPEGVSRPRRGELRGGRPYEPKEEVPKAAETKSAEAKKE